jgi:uncharacterized protein (UPF0332 family)
LAEIERRLIEGYIEKSRQKLEVARQLLRDRHFDDAVSRAYYAAFHAAQAALLAEGQRADSHRGVVTLIGLLLVKTGKLAPRFGRMLANLKDDREASDYDVVSFTDEETAAEAVGEAEEFCAAIRGYLSERGLLVVS